MKTWITILFAGVGIPLIIADASSTSADLEALDQRSDAGREERCAGLFQERGLPRDRAVPLCGCVVRESRRRGIDRRFGAYDEDGLREVANHCARSTGLL